MKYNDSAPASAQEMAVDISRIVQRLPKYAKLTWLLLKDPNLPRKQRLMLMAAVGYSVSPIDAIPGIIPVIGQLDDLGVVLYTLRWILRSMPEETASGYLSQAGLTMDTIEDDFSLVKRSGVRILKRVAALAVTAGVAAWGIGRSTGRELLRAIIKNLNRQE